MFPNDFSSKITRRRLNTFAFVFLLTLISAPSVLGCMCGKAATCERFNYSDAIFIGKAVRVEQKEKGSFKTESTVFEVRETFSGEKVDFISIQNKSGFSCDTEFAVGETYLVFANGDSKDGFGTGYCSGNLPTAFAEVEIAQLRNLSKAKGDGKLQGRVLQQFAQQVGKEERVPAKDIRLNIVETSTKRQYSTATNAEGRYQIAVPPGKYVVTPVTPAKAVPTFPSVPEPVEIRSGGCSEGFFVFSNKSRIAGRLVDAENRRVAYARVELVAIDEASSYQGGLSDESDLNGGFSIEEIPTGKYTMSINYNVSPRPDHPFPTTFFPFGSLRSAAEIFEIGSGTMIEGLIWKLPKPLEKQLIKGLVEREDGTPVVGAEIKLFDMAFPGLYAGCHFQESRTNADEKASPVRMTSLSLSGSACNLKSDSAGVFQMSTYAGRTYRVTASRTDSISEKKIEYVAESEPFLLSDQPHTVKLILKKPQK